MIKAKTWDGKSLTGLWEFTLKIDGVRTRLTPHGAFSRNNKKLYGFNCVLPSTGERDVETFMGSFKSTIEVVKNHSSDCEVKSHNIFSLDPCDPRLSYGSYENPSKEFITETLEKVVSQGYEGLILRQKDKWLKVKKSNTVDVPITGIFEGKGQFKGMLGGFYTDIGKVGTGFSHTDRKELFRDSIVGETVEVEFMELTADGIMRHPRFVRIRYDK